MRHSKLLPTAAPKRECDPVHSTPDATSPVLMWHRRLGSARCGLCPLGIIRPCSPSPHPCGRYHTAVFTVLCEWAQAGLAVVRKRKVDSVHWTLVSSPFLPPPPPCHHPPPTATTVTPLEEQVQNGTKETMQPCLLHLRVIFLALSANASAERRSGALPATSASLLFLPFLALPLHVNCVPFDLRLPFLALPLPFLRTAFLLRYL